MWLNSKSSTTTIDNNAYYYTTPYNNSSDRSLFLQTPTTFFPNTNDADTNLDVDSEIRSQTSLSSSSSPNSTSGSFPLSAFDSLPVLRNSRTTEDSLFRPTTPETQAQRLPPANMMYADAWAGELTFAPKNNNRSLHHRDVSLSSVSSFDPASPYSFNSAHPQIAINDSSDNYHTLQIPDDHSYQLAAKAPNSIPHDTFYANYPCSSDSTATQAYASMPAPQKHRGDRSAVGLLPPPDFPSGGSSNSRPASVASSDASDSPATPAAPEPQEEDGRRKTNGENFFLPYILDLDDDSYLTHLPGQPTVPKLDRTMTDVFSDELYNPNWSMSSAPPSQPIKTCTSPTHEMFVQRVQAANNQHLSVTTQSPIHPSSRGRSPFQQGSPLAPASCRDFSSPNMCFETAQQVREREKAQNDAMQIFRQTYAQPASSGASQTISPKDAILEFNDADNSNNFPLFPQQQPSGLDASQLSKSTAQANNFGGLPLDTSTFGTYLNSHIGNSVTMPQQYPFVSKSRVEPSLPSASTGSFSTPSQIETSASASPDTTISTSPRRPPHVGADGGTYTCTYHGCTQRFETPALLQKHKREGHRQAHGLNTLRRPEGPSASYFNTQAGPHKCERINPSTGKPCNTIFSRPYDLTRHEDTIHNGRKQKVRCDVCTEEKTFSRADALTRHYRVCHPDLEFPGKHRKRGGPIN